MSKAAAACKLGSQAGFTEVFHHDHNNVHNKIKVHKGVDIAGEREEPSLIVSVANEALPTHYCCTLLSIQQADRVMGEVLTLKIYYICYWRHSSTTLT